MRFPGFMLLSKSQVYHGQNVWDKNNPLGIIYFKIGEGHYQIDKLKKMEFLFNFKKQRWGVSKWTL